MCQADSNMEPVDMKTLSLVENGIEHKCRDYEALKRWTEEHKMPKEP